jgi:hypothetical protein
MIQDTAAATRRSLHGMAELVLAGPQYAASGSIRLQVTPGGFGTVAAPDLRIDGPELVTPGGRIPLAGTFGELAAAAGVEPRTLRDVYAGGPGVDPAEPVSLDPDAVRLVLDALAVGDAAMRAFAPDEQPVLWPEHFDVGISVAEVNYGVSPGDEHLDEPYAYVGPWVSREGPFWNAPFGAARPMTEVPGVDDVVTFFRAGQRLAAADCDVAG